MRPPFQDMSFSWIPFSQNVDHLIFYIWLVPETNPCQHVIISTNISDNLCLSVEFICGQLCWKKDVDVSFSPSFVLPGWNLSSLWGWFNLQNFSFNYHFHSPNCVLKSPTSPFTSSEIFFLSSSEIIIIIEIKSDHFQLPLANWQTYHFWLNRLLPFSYLVNKAYLERTKSCWKIPI